MNAMKEAIKREVKKHEGDYAFCGDCNISIEEVFEAGWKASKRHTTKQNNKYVP